MTRPEKIRLAVITALCLASLYLLAQAWLHPHPYTDELRAR